MKVFIINEEMKELIIHTFEFIQELMIKGNIRNDEEVYEAINYVIKDLKDNSKEIEIFKEGEENESN